MAGAQKFKTRGWMVALGLAVIGVAAAPWLQPAFRGASDRCHPEGLPTVKQVKLDVCVDVGTWSWLQTFQTRVQKFAVGNEKVYLDTIGQLPSWPMDEYRAQVLQRANTYATNTETVRILHESDVTLGGKVWHMIDMQSDTASFIDYYYSAEGFGSAELLFLSFNDNVPQRDALAAPVIASVKFTP